VFEALHREIRAGRIGRGGRLPSEAELVKRFGASRITVGRAMRDLQLAGIVERRAGSGTYVRAPESRPGGRSFGMLIPDLGETEIFDAICQGMMAAPQTRPHALVWGWTGGESREAAALELCRQYIDLKVDGVFFAPLEFTPGRHEVNRRIAHAFDEARIPLVLLDRPVQPYPHRGHHDLVGIDNRRAGFLAAAHLLGLGCRRLSFVALPNAAATVDAREAGYREAAHARGAASTDAHRLKPGDQAMVRALMSASRPEGIVCANDRTAALLMQALLAEGYAIPADVRLVGVDDLEYAGLLPVPLTTVRQPAQQIGAAAIAAMLDRMAHPELPPRDIILHCTLVVRRSCGAATTTPPARVDVSGDRPVEARPS
jgi:DNA-binding LacI/PurR family transcriptional regulator